MTELNKYEIIKKLVDINGNKDRAALKIGCTRRHINRLIKGYKDHGKAFFSHGNKGRKPVHAIPEDTKRTIIDLYLNKYYDANFTHFRELLEKHENIIISTSSLRSIFNKENIISPKATRATKKKVKLRLEALKNTANSKKTIVDIQENIIELEDAHPRRPRCAFFGEMIQMDASFHNWFGCKKSYLHIAIDDATGTIVGAYFDTQETLNGYYNVFYQILSNYGIPYMFYTDKRTVFEYKKRKVSSIEDDTFTQFGYACKQLGVDIKTTSIPQAKGRVERLFQTLQSRLIVELRLSGATSLEQANVFLNSYIKEYNATFALSIDNIKSVFELQPDLQKINLTLSVLANRKIDNGHCIRFDKKFFKPIDSNGIPVYYHKGTSALVIKAFDGSIYATINDKIYLLDEIPKHEFSSRNFDLPKVISSPKKRLIPPLQHPWKNSSFSAFVKEQKHLYDSSFEDACHSQASSY